MLKKKTTLKFFIFCLLLISFNAFSQTEIYKTNLVFDDSQSQELFCSMAISDNKILLSANKDLYNINKDSLKIVWQTSPGMKSCNSLYFLKDTFLYSSYQNQVLRCSEYDLKTGAKVRDLLIESINSKPHFVGKMMYCTALFDGGKLMAYDLEENKVVWQKNIGHGADFQPIYLKDKIIANAEDENWFEIDYDGNFVKTKSKKHNYLDSTQIFIKNYKFLTHDGKEITHDFLKKNRLSNSDYKTKTSDTHTFILAEQQLLVLGKNKKKVLQLDLEKEFPTENFDQDAYGSILVIHPESIWFSYQNFLIHYDFINKKRLRKVDLTKWNPHQLLVENRTIWLISKNDAQLYTLDFEPDHQTAEMLAFKAKMDFERHRCYEPDKERIELMKAAQEKYRKESTK
ncbi:hypothetical protein [Flavobacterium sp. 245]|uniref:hypothetical protein n=1 Tax=Flavobacterium sp. 245 TaxID=2512115 RepID=UPI00105CC7F4|nr:hypothetical protein [Flavobacterium sp. 245]TDP00719.1 hypothetical protein EV145_10598 [Flavobacterium sp. 245]